jgi:hypothetical protein
MVRRAGATKTGCLAFVLFFVAVMYFGIPVGETYFRYLKFKDAMKQELRFRSGLPNPQLIRNLQLVADSLGLPEEAHEITVTRQPGQVTVEATYEEIFRLPGFQKAIVYKPRATRVD